MSRDSTRSRVDATTPGPWRRSGTDTHPHWYVASPEVLVHRLDPEPDTVPETLDRWVADATFIAAARQDIPALLAVADASAALADNSDSTLPEMAQQWRSLRAALAALEAMP